MGCAAGRKDSRRKPAQTHLPDTRIPARFRARLKRRAKQLSTADSVIEQLADRIFRGLERPDHVADFAGFALLLRDAARFARTRVHHGTRPTLQLPCPPCRYQDVAVIAVKSFDELHGLPHLGPLYRWGAADIWNVFKTDSAWGCMRDRLHSSASCTCRASGGLPLRTHRSTATIASR